MNRRGFLGRLLGGSVAVAAPRVVEGEIADLPDVVVVDGVEFRWLGWDRQPYQDIYIGYWITAEPFRGERWYSSVYGIIAAYQIGHVFNGMVVYNESTFEDVVVTTTSTQDHRDRLRRRAFDRLVTYLRALPSSGVS